MFQKVTPKIVLVSGIALAISLLFAAVGVSQIPKAAKHHTAFQMSEPEAEWGPLIAHVRNLQIALEKDGGVEIEVVFFGPGINMLRRSNTNHADHLKRFAEKGVILAACQNSMRDRGISADDLFPFASQVDSGIAELTRKQEAGWAYIK
jgi:intracellular sulfur oxidation DsrE/DsrF family protein